MIAKLVLAGLTLGPLLSALPRVGEGLAAPALPSAPDQDAPLLLRLYDVAGLDPLAREDLGEATFEIVLPLIQPLALGEREESVARGELPSGTETGDLVFELVSELFGQELLRTGRTLEMLEGGRLLVRAPQAVHEGVATLLEFLRTVESESLELQVDVLVAEGGVLEAPASPVTSAARLRDLLAAPGEGVSHERYVLRLPRHRTGRVEHTVDVPVLAGMPGEIAQYASIHDPDLRTAPVGTRITGHAAPAPGGLELSLSLRRTRVLRDQVTSRPGTRQLVLQERVESVPTPDVRQHLRVEGRHQIVQCLLGDDEALWLHTRVDGRDELVVLTRRAGDLAPRHVLALGERGARLRLSDMDLLAGRRFRVESILAGRSDASVPLETWAGRDFRSQALATSISLQSGEADWFLDLLGDEQPNLMEGWAIDWPAAWAGDDGQELRSQIARHDAQASTFDVLAGQTAAGRARLDVQLVRDGDVLASASAPVLVGRPGMLVLGREELVTGDYTVEVAQGASLEVPETTQLFDGLALWFLPRAGEPPRIEVRGGAQVLGRRQELALAGSNTRELTLVERERVLAVEEIALRQRTGEAWSGSLGLEAGERGLRLDVRLAPLSGR